MAWAGEKESHTLTNGRTSQQLDQIGPVGRFGENHKIVSSLPHPGLQSS